MPTYRFYCLDSEGQIHAAEWFEAAGDEEALAMVQALHATGRCEVWKGSALVGCTTPQASQSRP